MGTGRFRSAVENPFVFWSFLDTLYSQSSHNGDSESFQISLCVMRILTIAISSSTNLHYLWRVSSFLLCVFLPESTAFVPHLCKNLSRSAKPSSAVGIMQNLKKECASSSPSWNGFASIRVHNTGPRSRISVALHSEQAL